MTKLSDTQLVVLSAASQRFDGNVLPLPGSLRGGAAKKVVGALLKQGLIVERLGQDHNLPDAALNTVWRAEPGGRAVRLFLTDAGREAIGVEPEAPAESATDAAQDAPKAKAARTPRAKAKAAPAAPTGADEPKVFNEPPFVLRSDDGATGEWYCIVAGQTFGPWPDKGAATAGFATEKRRANTRAGTKQAKLIEMLSTPDGASIAEIADAFGWAHHTVRGAIAGALKRKLGLDVAAEKVEGRGTVYRLGGEV